MIEAVSTLWTAGSPGLVPLLLGLLLFVVNGARLAWIDVRTHLLPNRIIFPWYPFALLFLGAAAVMAGDWAALVRMVFSGVVLFAFYLLLHVIYPHGMGLGDVKLAGIAGMYLGYLSWSNLLLGTLVTFLLSALVGVVLLSLRRVGLKSLLAFGPFIILGTAAGLIVAG